MHTCTSCPFPYSYPLAVYSQRFVLTIVLDNEIIPRLVFACGVAHCRTSATKHGCATTVHSMSLNVIPTLKMCDMITVRVWSC